VKTFWRENSLSIFFGAIFLASLVGQSFAGWKAFNHVQVSDGAPTVNYSEFLGNSEFWVDVVENWQSEYLQFLLFIWATVWLVQKGSPESKELGKEGKESDKDQKVLEHAEKDSPEWAKVGGWRTAVYSRSLGMVMGTIFVLSWLAQAITGRAAYNRDQIQQLQDPLGFLAYVTSADYWNRTLQNWQSEFLAVGSMAVLAIFLRHRGSPESKPVGSSHEATGTSG
jgi:hypothetical protein